MLNHALTLALAFCLSTTRAMGPSRAVPSNPCDGDLPHTGRHEQDSSSAPTVLWHRAADFRHVVGETVDPAVSYDYSSRKFIAHFAAGGGGGGGGGGGDDDDDPSFCPNDKGNARFARVFERWALEAAADWKAAVGNGSKLHVVDMEYWRPVYSKLWGDMAVYRHRCAEAEWTQWAVEWLAAPYLRAMGAGDGAADVLGKVGYYDIVTHGYDANTSSPSDDYVRFVLGGTPLFHSLYRTEPISLGARCPQAFVDARVFFTGNIVIPVVSPFLRHQTEARTLAHGGSAPLRYVASPSAYADHLFDACAVGSLTKTVVVWTSSADPVDAGTAAWVREFALRLKHRARDKAPCARTRTPQR